MGDHSSGGVSICHNGKSLNDVKRQVTESLSLKIKMDYIVGHTFRKVQSLRHPPFVISGKNTMVTFWSEVL